MSSFTYQLFKQYCFTVVGNSCIICGTTVGLEIDHIDPKSKSFNICKVWKTISKDDLDNELLKCQPLCQSCHGKKSGQYCKERYQKDRSQCHGTLSQYYGYKCRCDECKRVYSEYKLKRRGSIGYVRGPYKPVVCGTSSMYKRGCRCEKCRAAHNLTHKNRRERSRIGSNPMCETIKFS